jgi:SM-20-related protein
MVPSQEFSEVIVQTLLSPGFGWIDDFIDSEHAGILRAIADQRHSAGEFHQAGIGAGEVNLEIRRDQIRWIEHGEAPEPLKPILDCYRASFPAINSSCFLGLESLEAMLAIYPAGAFYRRHRDRFRRKAHRVVSLVLYLNENWGSGDGGELVLYPGPEVEGPSPDITIEPRAGRLVMFLSELEHEVRVTNVPRYSLTTWLLDRPD